MEQCRNNVLREISNFLRRADIKGTAASPAGLGRWINELKRIDDVLTEHEGLVEALEADSEAKQPRSAKKSARS